MNFDFYGHRYKFFIFSLSLLLIALIMGLVNGVKLDIQFKGGAILTYSYEGDLDINQVQSTVEDILNTQVNIQKTSDVTSGVNKIAISLATDQGLSTDNQKLINDTLTSKFASNNVKLLQTSSVEPTIGRQFLLKCLTAVAFASLVMVIYVAWRFTKIGGWSAGVMAVVALIHDILMAFATFIVLQIPLNDNFIAVILTIIGYSLNDTIVIYDRIRENKKLMGSKVSMEELANKSINQSFVRSINTSVTTTMAMTIVAVISVLYNITSIISFAVPMIVGLISGSYSTICIAGPLWVMWQKHKEKNRAEKRAKA